MFSVTCIPNQDDNSPAVVGVLFGDSAGKGGPPNFYRWFLKAAAKAGVRAYLFRPWDVPENPDRIPGYTLRAGSKTPRWIRSAHPLPDVIFDHIRSRAVENSPEVQAIRRRLAAAGCCFYGSGFLDKWHVHRVLSKHGALAKYLPETELLVAPRQVWEMLRRHRSIFVKPANGTLGIGVIRLTREGRCLSYQRTINLKQTESGRLQPGAELHRAIARWTSTRPYVVQQGLDLAVINGRPLDYRFLVQKDENDRWLVTFAFGKLAAKGKVVTNIANGGDFLTLDQALAPVAGAAWRRLAKKMEEASLAVALGVDQELGPLGELGLDLALDRKGRIWLLEVNSKFSRWVLPPQTRERSLIMAFRRAGRMASEGRIGP